VPEHEDVGVGEETVTPLLATLGRAAVMDNRKPQVVELDARHPGQTLSHLCYVVVAVDRNEPSGVSIERVERGQVGPVTRVDDDVCAIYLGPHLVGNIRARFGMWVSEISRRRTSQPVG
jgi:hypothetical protein